VNGKSYTGQKEQQQWRRRRRRRGGGVYRNDISFLAEAQQSYDRSTSA
jgi:hypothetical protein